MNSQSPKGKADGRGRNRNPVGGRWFPVSIELIDSGLLREMGGAEYKRYSTLLRIANFLGKGSFSASTAQLEKYDGISERQTFRVNAKLQERGLVTIDRTKNPYRYTLQLPSEWHKPGTHPELGTKPRIEVTARIEVTEKIAAPKW